MQEIQSYNAHAPSYRTLQHRRRINSCRYGTPRRNLKLPLLRSNPRSAKWRRDGHIRVRNPLSRVIPSIQHAATCESPRGTALRQGRGDTHRHCRTRSHRTQGCLLAHTTLTQGPCRRQTGSTGGRNICPVTTRMRWDLLLLRRRNRRRAVQRLPEQTAGGSSRGPGPQSQGERGRSRRL